MAPAPRPLSLRLGADGLRALDEIARRRGITRAEAARRAIAETAERDRGRAGLAAEARCLMGDPAYVREAREVAAALSTVVVCPTSTSAPAATFHPEILLGDEPTRVLCEMVGAVDARALGDPLGYLTHDEIRAVDEGLRLVLGMV